VATQPKPAVAYDGALVQFFVTPSRFVQELIEAPCRRSCPVTWCKSVVGHDALRRG
jgi:hypothetical protein